MPPPVSAAAAAAAILLLVPVGAATTTLLTGAAAGERGPIPMTMSQRRRPRATPPFGGIASVSAFAGRRHNAALSAFGCPRGSSTRRTRPFTPLSGERTLTRRCILAVAENDGIDDVSVSPRSSFPPLPDDLVECISPREWEQRCALAAAYRISYLHDWHENIFNHITLKVDGSSSAPDGPHFLLNDFGIGFDEITACNLLKVNLDGIVVPTTRPLPDSRRTINRGKGRVFKPGYVLHSAIHAARDDVHAIWHGHDLDTTAVSQTKFGILPLSQEATFALNKGISYHPFEGSANNLEEQPRLVKNLGPKNKIVMLEDHGPIVACPTIEEAFVGMYFLTRACKFQIKSLSAAGGDLSKMHLPDGETYDEMLRRADKFDDAPSSSKGVPVGAESTVVDESDKKSKGGGNRTNADAEKHDTEGLMFAYARRSAEKYFGPIDIYR